MTVFVCSTPILAGFFQNFLILKYLWLNRASYCGQRHWCCSWSAQFILVQSRNEGGMQYRLTDEQRCAMQLLRWLCGVFSGRVLGCPSIRHTHWVEGHSNGRSVAEKMRRYGMKTTRKKMQLPDYQIAALNFCWVTRTRTLNNRTKICCVTITPWPNRAQKRVQN